MHFLSVLFLTLSANIDSLLLGLSYSMKNIKISFQSNILIAILTTLGTFLSMKFGHLLLTFLSIDIANRMGAIFLLIIGIISLFPIHSAQKTTTDLYQTMSLKETLILGLTLSINNIGLSLGASITGLPYLSTCFFTFLISFFFIAVSQKIGQAPFFQSIQVYAPILSSLMIIILGLYEFIV